MVARGDGRFPRVEGLSYLVCATQRSGSTLLCELLKGTEVAGVPDEFFEALRSTGLPRQPRQYFEDPSVADIAERLAPLDAGRPEQPGEFEGWFAYVLQRGTTRNGVFGSKMMWNYFDDFRDRVRELPGLGVAHLQRGARCGLPQPSHHLRPAPRQGEPGGVAVEGHPDPAVADGGRRRARPAPGASTTTGP